MEKVLFKCLNAFSRRHVHVKKGKTKLKQETTKSSFYEIEQ